MRETIYENQEKVNRNVARKPRVMARGLPVAQLTRGETATLVPIPIGML